MNSTLAASFGLADTEALALSGSTAQRIYTDLRRRIITLDLPPDTTLSRTELTDTYGVSQTPIREALQLLRQEGLVHIHPQSKTVVTRIDAPKIFEAHFLRVALETEVCRELASGEHGGTVSRAASIIRMQEAVAGDPEQLSVFQELDELFHRTLFVGLGRRALQTLVRERSGHLERARRLHLPERGKIVSILEGHRAIVAAIGARDVAGATAAIRAHLGQTVARVEDLRREFPDYFA